MKMDKENNNTEYDITKNPHFNKLLEILACPKCKGKLEYQAHKRRWLCSECSRYYYIENGVPNFLIDESVIVVRSPESGEDLEFSSERVRYINESGEVFSIPEIEKILQLKLVCLEEGCEGNLIFDEKKMAYLCNRCNTEYPIPNGITNCLKEHSYS